MAHSEYCRGCLCIGNETYNCSFAAAHNDKGQCPCTQCIIKVMCGKQCSDFISFKKTLPFYQMKEEDS